MKIMLLIPTNKSGGAERVMSVLGDYLIQQGYEVCLVNLDADTAYYPYPATVKTIKLGVDYLPGQQASMASRWLRDYRALTKVMKEERPDAAIIFLNMAELVGAGVAWHLKIPHILSIRNDPRFESLAIRLSRRWNAAHCDALVCQSEAVSSVYASVQANRIIIGNPLSPNAVSDDPLPDEREKVILYVGRLSPQKNPQMLLEAFAMLDPAYQAYRLRMVGSGELETSLKQKAEELGIGSRVEWAGTVANPLKVYRSATCYVCSSHYEGMSNALMEAMANGIPSISTDVPSGTARTLINDGENGFIVPCGDAAALCGIMERLLANPALQQRFSQNGLAVGRMYEQREVCGQWEKVLRSILLKKKAIMNGR